MAMVRLMSNGVTTSILVHRVEDHWGLRERQAKDYTKESRVTIIDVVNR